MENKVYLLLLVILRGLMSVWLLTYFFNVTELIQLTNIPVTVISGGIVYIICQLISRRISAAHHWWDWVYYFGLVLLMIPASFASTKWFTIALPMTQIGTILLVFPVLADLIVSRKR